jgi:hypothetical protein
MAAGPWDVQEVVCKNFPACHQGDADCWNGFLDTTYQITGSYPILYKKRADTVGHSISMSHCCFHGAEFLVLLGLQ